MRVTPAMSAIEMACWDILGKSLGLPVHQLLGGQVRDKIRVYANGWYSGDRTPEGFGEKAAEVVSIGYTGLKFDPFGTEYTRLSRDETKETQELIRAVRDTVPCQIQVAVTDITFYIGSYILGFPVSKCTVNSDN